MCVYIRDHVAVKCAITLRLLDKYPDGDALRPAWEAVVPRRRLNDEGEIADAVTFLLGTSGMTGSVLVLDAGGGQRITVPS